MEQAVIASSEMRSLCVNAGNRTTTIAACRTACRDNAVGKHCVVYKKVDAAAGLVVVGIRPICESARKREVPHRTARRYNIDQAVHVAARLDHHVVAVPGRPHERQVLLV